MVISTLEHFVTAFGFLSNEKIPLNYRSFWAVFY